MKQIKAGIKVMTMFVALLMGFGVIVPVSAQTEEVFYSNIAFGALGSPSFKNFGPYEIADDVPFTGSHLISSFRIGYLSTTEPVHATFRFYGVDSNTGKPGQLIAEIVRDLPITENVTLNSTVAIIQLDANEQFTFTAESGLNNMSNSGGWYSLQFESLTGGRLPSFGFGMRLAAGTSSAGLYVMATGATVTTLDASGILPSSLYLELRSSESGGVVVPQVSDVTMVPSTVKAGDTATVVVSLSAQAPQGGTLVKLTSSKPGSAYFGKSEILVKAGTNGFQTTVFTSRKVGRKGKKIKITAEANGGSASDILTLTR